MTTAKERFYWNCGKSMGVIESRHYDRLDTCGNRECDRAARDVASDERDEYHDKLDHEMEWGW